MNRPPLPKLYAPPGHFLSPVVDPDALRRGGFHDRRATDRLAGLEIDLERMAGLFMRLMCHAGTIDFPEQRSPGWRYFYENSMYSYGDAIILAAMIREFLPSRYIEVGSGFSSAAVLDTRDRLAGHVMACTFIEPYPTRLEALLTPADRAQVEILQAEVQHVPLGLFETLAPGDILFLDSTHVSKTGSDVNHEVFQILPLLAAGVIVHFHDVFGDFEYPDGWVFGENRSWNEQYLLRAFLMYNNAFEVIYANDAFFAAHYALVEQHCPLIARNPGGGLWLRRR
jgi:Methyltransferase domain